VNTATTDSGDDELHLLGPIIAITALAIAAIVLLKRGTVGSFWWMLMLAVAAPAVVELALELRRRRTGPAASAPTRPSDSATRGIVDPSMIGAAAPAPPVGGPVAAPVVPSAPASGIQPSDPDATRELRVPLIPLQQDLDAPGARISAIQVPKSTNDHSTCEDAVAVHPSGTVIAVSDGASSAFMSRAWARVLTSAYAEQPPESTLQGILEWTGRCTRAWAAAAADATDARDGDEWWNAASTARGSHATLLGLRLHPHGADGRIWSAIAVGDTVLAHVRPNDDDVGVALLRSFPIEGGDAFDATPELLPTLTSGDVADLPAIRTSEGTAEAGDSLIIMTDALAEWALRAHGSGRSPWSFLLSADADAIAGAVGAARQDRTMVDDDVSLVRVTLGGLAAATTLEALR
jgi:hypothetical protein